MNALLPAVLLRGTENTPDLQAITRRLDDLYGASVSAHVRRIGDVQTTGLACSFMEDRFAFGGDTILEPMIAFLEELLTRPLTENGAFSSAYVESEKANLVSAIESYKNDKRSYATSQILKLMCQEDSFGIPRLGTAEQAKAVTAQGLFDHYKKILQESPVHIFYVGSADPEQVAALLRPMASSFAQRAGAVPEQTAFTSGNPSEHTEVMDVSQGRLCMGYVTPITLRDPRFPAMQVMNVALGAGMTSKLFMNIREKMSLCYDISSSYHGSKGIALIYAGIDFDQADRVRREIKQQMEACRRGDFSPEELEAARQMLLTQLEAVHDSPGAIESYYATGAVSGLNKTPEEYRQAVLSVTVEQVAEAASTLKLNTVYFLRGAQDD